MTGAARSAALRPIPATALTILSIVTSVMVGRLFDGDAYLRGAVVLVVAVHLVALALRWSRLHALVAMPLLALVILELAAVVLHRTTLAGPFPTGDTIRSIGEDLRTVIDHFTTAVAPVPDSGAYANTIVLSLALVAAVSDTLAFRGGGRIEAVVPHAVLLVLTIVLANGAPGISTTAVWLGVALVVVATLRFDRWSASGVVGDRSSGWATTLPAITVTAAVCAVAAGIVGPRLPGADAAPLVDPGGAGSSVTEVVSPLIGIGSRLTSNSTRELFSVSSSDGPHYWRVMALDDFDGASWSPSPESLGRADDSAADAMSDVAGARVDQVVTISALGGHLVPAAHVAVAVSPESVLFAPRSQSLVMPEVELARGDVITVRSRVLRPSIEQLRATTVARAPSLSMYDVPGSIPDSVRADAFDATSGAATAYDRAIALQDWFRISGGFTYDVTAEYGNSSDAIVEFLQQRRGFCQQFATTFAVMARIVGLPSRVVVGFTPGDVDSSGVFHVYGRHAHAWPEVWFDGMGWVAFEPTPGRGSPDGVGYLPGVAAQQDDTRPPTDTSETTTSTVTPDPSSTTTTPADGSAPIGGSAPRTTTHGGAATSGDSSTGGATTAVVVVAVLALLVVAVLAVRRTRRRGAPASGSQAVERAWIEVCRDLRLVGAPAPRGTTPLEYAALAAGSTGVEPDSIHELARLVTLATYAPTPADDLTVGRSRMLADQVHHTCLATVSPWTRLQSRVRDALG
jgi:MYXO-CTERM domain-containing protein